MAGPRAIYLALDLARMPALARAAGPLAVPHDALELIRIAAACPHTCRAAAMATGVPAGELVEAARFYLQQSLFRADADCYRVLGLQRGASRDVARQHMRWLLQWLHPDRNSGWDGVYAERVVRAWREIAAGGQPAATAQDGSAVVHPVRLPWITMTAPRPAGRRRHARR